MTPNYSISYLARERASAYLLYKDYLLWLKIYLIFTIPLNVILFYFSFYSPLISLCAAIFWNGAGLDYYKMKNEWYEKYKLLT